MHLLESMLNFVAVSQEVQMKKAQQSEPATHQFAGWHSSHCATAAAHFVTTGTEKTSCNANRQRKPLLNPNQ